jgi:hypothetical protein
MMTCGRSRTTSVCRILGDSSSLLTRRQAKKATLPIRFPARPFASPVISRNDKAELPHPLPSQVAC